MERTNEPVKSVQSKKVKKVNVEEEEPVLAPAARPMLTYRVLNGTLRIGGKSYKVNQTFTAYPEQIPAAFLKSLTCVSPEEIQLLSKTSGEKPMPKEVIYEVKPARAKDWYNVINNVTGKPINEKTLKLEDAERLRDALNT